MDAPWPPQTRYETSSTEKESLPLRNPTQTTDSTLNKSLRTGFWTSQIPPPVLRNPEGPPLGFISNGEGGQSTVKFREKTKDHTTQTPLNPRLVPFPMVALHRHRVLFEINLLWLSKRTPPHSLSGSVLVWKVYDPRSPVVILPLLSIPGPSPLSLPFLTIVSRWVTPQRPSLSRLLVGTRNRPNGLDTDSLQPVSKYSIRFVRPRFDDF